MIELTLTRFIWKQFGQSCHRVLLDSLYKSYTHAGIFAEGGMKSYLEYVRYSTDYSSRYIESTLEWRDDVPDGMEVSVFKPPHGAALPSSSSQQASVATSSL